MKMGEKRLKLTIELLDRRIRQERKRLEILLAKAEEVEERIGDLKVERDKAVSVLNSLEEKVKGASNTRRCQ